jgi:hypothetical protein
MQVSILCLILVPAVVAPVSNYLAAAALLALVYSFAADIVYLIRKRVSA